MSKPRLLTKKENAALDEIRNSKLGLDGWKICAECGGYCCGQLGESLESPWFRNDIDDIPDGHIEGVSPAWSRRKMWQDIREKAKEFKAQLGFPLCGAFQYYAMFLQVQETGHDLSYCEYLGETGCIVEREKRPKMCLDWTCGHLLRELKISPAEEFPAPKRVSIAENLGELKLAIGRECYGSRRHRGCKYDFCRCKEIIPFLDYDPEQIRRAREMGELVS